MLLDPTQQGTDGTPETDASEVLISFDNVSKKFCRNLRRSMAYGLLELSRNLMGLKVKNSPLRKGEFWALKDLSFEMRRGETLGVMGLNGSGKTTLLRMIAGIFPPDKGEIIVKGRVGTLIAMGAGFHPHMTGRENIYVNGSIMGMTRAELDAQFDDIVDFAEVGKFLDAPLSTYSSGMRVRLGFAIATAIIPDILLLDEVFAVGDIVFRQRSLERIQHILNNAAVILVSNRPEYIELLCSRAFWLEKGQIIAEGDVEEVATRYGEESSQRSVSFAMRKGTTRDGNGDIRFDDAVRAYGAESGDNAVLMRKEELIVEVPFTCHKPWSEVHFQIKLIDLMSGMPMSYAECEVPEVTMNGTFRCTFYNVPFMPRSYAVSLKISHADTALDIWRFATHFSALRPAKPPKREKKHPHEITIQMGDTVFEHSYKRPKKAEASAP